MKFYLLSPESVPMNPVLFPMMVDTFISKGHSFVDRIEDCDCVMMDLHTRIANYNADDINKLCWGDNGLATFCEWDRGNLSTDEWPHPLTHQQAEIFLHGKHGRFKTVHFCRLLDKTKTYPENLYPYEKPYLYEEPLLSPDELFNREYDVVYIANHSASREAIAKAIFDYGKIKIKFSLGEQKIPFEDFVKEHKRGKLFISSGAGGYTDERKQFLFSIAGIIQERTDQLLLHELPLTGCIYIGSPPTIENLDLIYNIVNDKECLYKIYENGYNFMKTYYSKEYIANDILNKIKKHLW
jgi:hypothetical protein